MSLKSNSPVHFYKPAECCKFVYRAPVVRSILLEKDAVETGDVSPSWRFVSQKRQGND